MYVGAAKVEEPGDLVQLGDEDALCLLLTKRLPYAFYLALGRLAGELQRLNLHLVLWDGRAVCPKLFGRVEIRAKLDAGLVQRRPQLLNLRWSEDRAVDTDRLFIDH